MGQALYRKYRSKSLGEIVGQEHITTTLEHALKSGKISHAYLFTGPRGVGKTSIARILAHEINQLPYEDDQSHIDIIEIDAASNNGVEDVRDLREKVYVAPALAKYKVYIIDEVHMLSKPAFNALLKTLEEPPAHAVFILATTEMHKLPATIVSRTQRFVFRPIEADKAVAHLREIATAEKIDASDEALRLIASHGGGSFRDSISLLDQAGSRGGSVDAEAIENLLGIPSETAITTLLTALQTGSSDISGTAKQLAAMYEQGYQASAIAKRLSAQIRQQIIEQTLPIALPVATDLLTKLLEVPIAHDPERYLEIILLAAIPVSAVTAAKPAAPQPDPTPAAAPKPKAAAKPAASSADTPAKTKAAESAATPEKPAAKKPAAGTAALDAASWQAVLNQLKSRHNTLYGLARMAQPTFPAPGQLELTFAFAFHQKRLADAKNRQLVIDAVVAVTGQPVEIICSVDPSLKSRAPEINEPLPDLAPPAEQSPAPAGNPLENISNIFGGAELLDS